MAASRLVAAAAIVVVVLVLAGAGAAGAAGAGEVRALLDLAAGLDPTGRLLPSWAPGRDPCGREGGGGFEGVACDGATGAVANVSLQGKGLAGTLPPAVAGLTALTGLYLHYNRLTGALPRELAALSRLTDLYLNVNNFSGPIPPEIAAMPSLQGQFTLSSSSPSCHAGQCQHGCVLWLRYLFLGSFFLASPPRHVRSPGSGGLLHRLDRLDFFVFVYFGLLGVCPLQNGYLPKYGIFLAGFCRANNTSTQPQLASSRLQRFLGRYLSFAFGFGA